MGIQFGHVISKWRSVNFKPIKKTEEMTHKLKKTLLVITLAAVAVRNITKKIPKLVCGFYISERLLQKY